MSTSPRIVCVIPARLASTRLPEKILYPIKGKALLEHTWRAASSVSLFDSVVVAIDNEQVAQLVTSFGGSYVSTDPSCPTGTHRMIEAVRKLPNLNADIWVNWQADVPLPAPTMITDLLHGATPTNAPHVWTLKTRITNPADVANPDTVKVVAGRDNTALYFSRAPIPYYTESYVGERTYYKHVGLYAFTSAALEKIATATDPSLAHIESLEQLQFMTAGIPITVNETAEAIHTVDNLQDVAAIEHAL